MNDVEVIKEKDHVLVRTNKGEYHFTYELFNHFDNEEEAIELAKKEIEKKNNTSYSDSKIDFKRARSLGFCEYGIKEFCEMLNLDINKEYELEFLNKKLTIEAIKAYPDECIKLFGENTLKYLGGVKEFLSEDTIDIVLRKEFLSEEVLHRLSVKFAYSCLHIFEEAFPDDDRSRKAIEAKEKWIRGEIDDRELEKYRDAARAAARAASSDASDASDAAASAAAAAYAAASDASARAAAYAAASYAEKEKRWKEISDILVELIKGMNK